MDVNAGSTGTPNRLIHETSPYLRQHAHNPVDWYPWGDEALQAAREQDRPIFLSIGYSACHWCHVMEHESFEDPQIAELMSRLFVCIKVDREERPDLDQIYMNSVQLLTGHGGWPMSVFLTPDLKPFYGGTYWPPYARGRMPGFRDVLQKVREAWDERRDEVHRAAEQLTTAVVDSLLPHAETHALNESLMEIALRDLKRAADRTHGGFGRAPKFPHPMDLRLLLRLWKRLGDDDALHIVRFTLDKMARGGIYDHLGGGFHRYSTDARWLAPHFEKMLYDNALLAAVYLEAFQATGESEFQQVARGILDYVLREMTQDAGGFFSTQDADSEGEEGRFFVWSEEEIVRELGPDDARLFNDCYDVTAAGNWEGKNILNRPKPHAEAARVLGVSEEELAEVLSRCREKLFAVRSRRVAPGRDDKVLVSWNGMMIAAMAMGARVLGESRYAEAARKAADFILDNMRRDDGRLLHTYKDGQARLDAYLDDYACLIDGLAELYQATFNVRHLESAVELVEQMLSRFPDPAGGFYYTADDHEALIARSVDSQDNAVPSGNAMAATALLKIGRLCARPELEDQAVAVLERLSGQMARLAMASGQALLATDFVLGPAREIVIADGSQAASNTVAERELAVRFVPNKVVLRRPHGTSDEELPEVVRTMLTGKHAEGAEPEIYICEKGVCHAPVRGASGLAAALERVPDPQKM